MAVLLIVPICARISPTVLISSSYAASVAAHSVALAAWLALLAVVAESNAAWSSVLGTGRIGLIQLLVARRLFGVNVLGAGVF